MNKAPNEKCFEGTVEVLLHRISFYFKGQAELTDELKQRLTEEAEERAKHDIELGCVSGELCYEDNDTSFRGWWNMERNS